MGSIWKKITATTLLVAFLIPNGSFNASAVENGYKLVGLEQSDIQSAKPWQMEVVKDTNQPYFIFNDSTTLSAGTSKTHDYEMQTDDTSRKFTQIKIKVESQQIDGDSIKTPVGNDIVLDSGKTSGENDYLKAEISAWPIADEKVKLKLTAKDSAGGVVDNYKYTATVTATIVDRGTFSAGITKVSNTVVSVGSKSQAQTSDGKYYEDDEVTLSIKPDPQGEYKLISFDVSYKVGDNTKKTTIKSSQTWEDWTVSWNDKTETKMVGKIKGDISISNIVVQKIPKEYTVKFDAGNGVILERPSSSSVTVQEGESVFVRIRAKDGYLIDDCTLQSGKTYGTWVYGQNFLTIGNTRIEVKQDGDYISFTIPDIYEDMTVKFTSTYDYDNIPIETDEGSRIDIYTDAGSTVTRGSDVLFYISTTSDNYSVNRITLRVGDEQNTVNASDGEIKVGNKNYAIDDLGDGVYSLLVKNVTQPIKVSATSTSSSSSNVSRPRITISASSNMKITKSISGYQINSGEDVRFYFTPNKNYQIQDITVKMGSSTKTVSAGKTSITVDGNTYLMSRDSSGEVTLYLTNITKNVTVSATAYFSRDSVTPTSSVYLNTYSRSPFVNGYADGTFRPQNYMTRAEAVSMLYKMSAVSNATSQNVYADVPYGMWCATQVNTFANAGIIDKTGYFYPNRYVTRAEMAQMVYRLVGSPEVPASSIYFKDVSNTENNNAIRYAAYKGWVTGYTDQTFRPYQYMTRAEVVTMMCKVVGRSYGDMTQKYKDVKSGYWAYPYIQMASSYV